MTGPANARVAVTGFAWLEPAPDARSRDDWALLPDPDRAEIDRAKEDARWPRLDRAARVLALAAHRALAGRAVAGDGSGLVLGTLSGCLEADERFEATRGQEGGASPLLFPPTLATAPAAELSIRLGLRGPVSVVSSGETSLLAAVALGAQLVALGEATLVLACGLEVASRSAALAFGRAGPFAESAACLVLEPEGSTGPRALAFVEPAWGESSTGDDASGRATDRLGNRAGPGLARALATASRGSIALVGSLRVTGPTRET